MKVKVTKREMTEKEIVIQKIENEIDYLEQDNDRYINNIKWYAKTIVLRTAIIGAISSGEIFLLMSGENGYIASLMVAYFGFVIYYIYAINNGFGSPLKIWFNEYKESILEIIPEIIAKYNNNLKIEELKERLNKIMGSNEFKKLCENCEYKTGGKKYGR